MRLSMNGLFPHCARRTSYCILRTPRLALFINGVIYAPIP